MNELIIRLKVIILLGISGSGKSTFIRDSYPGAAVVSADHFFMVNGEYVFDGSKLPEAHGACLKQFIERASSPERRVYPDYDYDNQVLIVDNTNTTVHEIAPYAAVALAYGHELELVVIHCDPKVAAARCIHDVPTDRVALQYKRLMNTLAKSPEGHYKALVPWWPVKEVGNVS